MTFHSLHVVNSKHRTRQTNGRSRCNTTAAAAAAAAVGFSILSVVVIGLLSGGQSMQRRSSADSWCVIFTAFILCHPTSSVKALEG